MRHVIPISGKDSLCTALVLLERESEKTYEYIYNDVGADIPDVAIWLSTVENRLNIKIHRIGMNLEDIILDQGILPSFRARYCTRMAKIYPMEDYLGKEDSIVYYGIRADEKREGYRATKKNIVPDYPLVRYNIDLDGVYKMVGDLLPPSFFWKRLYDLVEKEVDCSTLPLHTKHQLFSWRTRMNCFFCFYQRQYEWIGLLEHYPDLFYRAVEMEETIGAKDFTWNPSKSLRTMQEQQDTIVQKRANRIIKFLKSGMMEEEEGMSNLINVVSCGLLCGK